MLDRQNMIHYLNLTSDELEKRNLVGEIIISGFASMALVHDPRDPTKDINALYQPKSVINEIMLKIAEIENINANWLNDGVKAFVNSNAPIENFLDLKALTVYTVTPDYLLAMKLMASRLNSEDYADIKFLFKKLDITSFDKATAILLTYFKQEEILPKVQYVIQTLIADI